MHNSDENTLVQADPGIGEAQELRITALEAELAASKRKLASLEAGQVARVAAIRQIPFGLVLFDDKGELHEINERFGEFCGRSAETIRSREDLESIPLFEEFGLVRPLGKLLDESEGFTRDQSPGVAFAGDGRFLRFDGRCLHGLEGEVLGYALVADDIADLGDATGRLKSSLGHMRRVMLGAVEAMSSMVERRDPFVAGHQKRVAQLSLAIGSEMGMDVFALEGLRIMALLHDIGKVAVPAEILCKPARLSKAESGVVRMAPAIAGRILNRVEFPWPVADVVKQHQERIDGSGYPDGLKGDEIRIEARILAVADTVEAMLTYRPYRPAHDLEVVMAEIESGRGLRFEPRVVDACLKLFREKNFDF
jgi:HD-GYP domain-containing protein (c-di-GMP phosphodiesterase class II)